MEPDSSPIRSGWLDALESTAKANRHAWMLGSRPLYNPDGDVVANVQWTTAELRGHLNGNALYRLADDCFNSVLCRVEAEFADEPFDMSLHSYAAMASARDDDERRVLYGRTDCSTPCEPEKRFATTQVLANTGRSMGTTAQLRRTMPHTFVVHGATLT